MAKGEVWAGRPPIWVRMFWGFLPLLLLLGGYGAVIMTQKSMGYAWDEAYYYDPSLRAADWLTAVLHGDRPFDEQSIERYWNDDGRLHPEHPSLQKFLSGIAMRSFMDPNCNCGRCACPSPFFLACRLI